MRSAVLFNYNHSSAFLSALDVRSKLIIFLWLNIVTVFATYSFLLLLLLMGIVVARLERARGLFYAMRGVFFLAFIVVLAKSLSDEGAPLIEIGHIVISSSGMVSGFAFAMRLVLMVIWAHLLVSSTRIDELEAGLGQLFCRLPVVGRFAPYFASALSLMLSFLPLITSEAALISDALKARQLDAGKRPVRYIVAFASTLLQNLLLMIFTLTDALYARFYNPAVVRHMDKKSVFSLPYALLLVFAGSIVMCLDFIFVYPALSAFLPEFFV